MANYFVINNKFKPYSFDELIKPYQMYGEAYKEQESALSDLNQQASTLAAALSETNDPVAYATYSKYLADVQAAADEIATSGLSNSSRRKVKDLSARYNGEISPIQNAYNKREQLAKEIRQARLNNPTLMVERDMNIPGIKSSIDRFVENPNYDYGRVYTGTQLAQDVGTAAKALSTQLRDPGSKGQALRNELRRILPGQYQLLEERGFNDTEVLAAIMRDPNASPVLTKIVDDVITSSGMKNWENYDELKNQIYDAASRGLWNAVGQDSYHYLNTNTGSSSSSSSKTGKGSYIDRTAYYFSDSKDKLTSSVYDSNGELKRTQDDKQTIIDTFFDDKGKLKAKETMAQETQRHNYPYAGPTYNNPELQSYNAYNDVINTLLNEGYTQNQINRMSANDMKRALNAIYNEEQNDVVGHVLYRQRLDDTTSKYLQGEINKQGIPLERVVNISRDEDGNVSYKTKTERKAKIDENAANILFDPRTNQFLIQSGGEYYKMPGGILSTETTLDSTVDSENYRRVRDTIDEIEQRLYDAEIGKIELSDSDRRDLEARMIKALETLEIIDERLGNYGYEFVNYVGKSKVNGS